MGPNSVAEAMPLFFMIEQPAQPLDHFVARAKVNGRMPLRPQNLAMLLGVFGEHARSHCSDFECPHRTAIAVCPPHEAQRYSCASDRFPHGLRIRDTACD